MCTAGDSYSLLSYVLVNILFRIGVAVFLIIFRILFFIIQMIEKMADKNIFIDLDLIYCKLILFSTHLQRLI